MAKELQKWATVFVVAPSEEQSATSLSITVRKPLTIERRREFPIDAAWSVTGTPADCVKAALSIVLQTSPDIVVSGINKGSNAGKNILYSGTIGGAIEATLRGIRSVAFSSYSVTNPSFEKYAPYTSSLVQYALSTDSYSGALLNVNFPCQSVIESLGIQESFAGFKLARQGKEYILENPLFVEAPNKHDDHHGTVFHMGGKFHSDLIEDELSDIHWLRNGYTTCVPIYVEDLTYERFIQCEKNNFEKLFNEKRES